MTGAIARVVEAELEVGADIVGRRIATALADGRGWRVLSVSTRPVAPSERALAGRLLRLF